MSKVYEYDEISKHNTKEDLWMAIDGKVYDCTEFLDEHPGGEEVMVDCGGMDATGPFDDVGHSEEAREMLEPMLIGTTAGPAPSSSGVGASATTGGEQNVGLIIAILVVVLAIAGYLTLK